MAKARNAIQRLGSRAQLRSSLIPPDGDDLVIIDSSFYIWIVGDTSADDSYYTIEQASDATGRWKLYGEALSKSSRRATTGLAFDTRTDLNNYPKPIAGVDDITFQPFAVKFTASYGEGDNITTELVQFPLTVYTVASNNVIPMFYYLVANSNGTLSQQITKPTLVDETTKSVLGSFVEVGGALFQLAQLGNAPAWFFQPEISGTDSFTRSQSESIGNVILTANDDNLALNRSKIDVTAEGAGFIPAARPVSDLYMHSINGKALLDFAYVDPLNGYVSAVTTEVLGADNANWVTQAPIDVNWYGIQIFCAATPDVDAVDIIIPPQVYYGSMTEAVQALESYDIDLEGAAAIPKFFKPYGSAIVKKGVTAGDYGTTDDFIITKALPSAVTSYFNVNVVNSGGAQALSTGGVTLLDDGVQIGAEFEFNTFNLTRGLTATLTSPGVAEIASSAFEQGVAYYDPDTIYMYVVYGVDGDWEAIRYLTADETTGANQTGVAPTSVAELKLLTYA